MKAENRGQRVRGVVVVGNSMTGCISKDNPDCIVAYTHWFRHDDDLTVLDRELEQLAMLYANFSKTHGVSYSYEYKDYIR